jgi:hypothetical protein
VAEDDNIADVVSLVRSPSCSRLWRSRRSCAPLRDDAPIRTAGNELLTGRVAILVLETHLRARCTIALIEEPLGGGRFAGLAQLPNGGERGPVFPVGPKRHPGLPVVAEANTEQLVDLDPVEVEPHSRGRHIEPPRARPALSDLGHGL